MHAAQAGQPGAVAEAATWQRNAEAWTARLLAGFPLYRDLLQPVALAVYELRSGLSLLTSATAANAPDLARARQLSALLVRLMAFPAADAREGAALPLCMVKLDLLHVLRCLLIHKGSGLSLPGKKELFSSHRLMQFSASRRVPGSVRWSMT